MPFTNKIGVITGGANGIGLCIAQNFYNKGAQIAILDMDTGEHIQQSLGDRLLYMQGDAADEKVVRLFAEKVLDTFGKVDYLINNACVSKKGILSDCSYDDFMYVLRLGVATPYLLASLFKEHFTHGASIINIASSRAFMSQADTESYTAAKGGISALTHALCVSFAGKVRVNAISPGWIDTSTCNEQEETSEHSKADMLQHPVGRVGKPEDISSLVGFLCSNEASFINGQNILVDGGMTKHMIYHNDNGWILSPDIIS